MAQKTRIRLLAKLSGLFTLTDFLDRQIGYEQSANNLVVRNSSVLMRFGATTAPRAISGAANIVIDGQNSVEASFSMYSGTPAPMTAARTITVNTATMPDGASYRIEVGADGTNRVLTFPQTGGGFNHFLFNATNGTDRNRTVTANQRRIILLSRSGNSFYWTFDIYR